MTNLGLFAFYMMAVFLGFQRPFIWVLLYLYVDIVTPQHLAYGLLTSLPISLITFVLAVGGWAAMDDKRDSRFTWRQGLIVALLCYCGLTTLFATFPTTALEKWSWVWKVLVFAVFLPLTLRTRARIEATVLTIILAGATLYISAGIKTAAGGGGYDMLQSVIGGNSGLAEGSTMSAFAIATIPLLWWAVRHGEIMPRGKLALIYAGALTFACLLVPVGTQARTGLICMALLAVLLLRTVKRRALFASMLGVAVMVAIPFLPKSFTDRMSTIENHQADQSASTRVAVWKWTWDYAKSHPFGGGFSAYLANKVTVELRRENRDGSGGSVSVQAVEDKARAYHSAYFEMLGEQGYPGLLMWLVLHFSGLWQMERIRARWRKRTGPGETWQAPLANALQQAQAIYLVGALFVGIAFQPLAYMLIAVQCGLVTYTRRLESGRKAIGRGPSGRPGLRVTPLKPDSPPSTQATPRIRSSLP